jgi:hypothetical protein
MSHQAFELLVEFTRIHVIEEVFNLKNKSFISSSFTWQHGPHEGTFDRNLKTTVIDAELSSV